MGVRNTALGTYLPSQGNTLLTRENAFLYPIGQFTAHLLQSRRIRDVDDLRKSKTVSSDDVAPRPLAQEDYTAWYRFILLSGQLSVSR